MLYKKLERIWSHGYANYIPKFRETFPELSKLNDEEMCDRWRNLGVEFYSVKETPVNLLVRLLLPFALLLMLLMIVFLPLHFMVAGKWGYSLEKGNHIYNWFKSLKLL